MSETERPNVILILVDDMGFSDLGCMGSEIQTPNIDVLAREGVLLSSMYNCARCCPTRASVLTGLYAHRAGIGQMGVDFGTPAYQGHLRDDAVTIAEALREAGYRTLMSGKWHVGGEYDARFIDTWQPGTDGRPTPRQRGFDRFFGIVDGCTHYFSPHYLMEDDERVTSFDDDFYMTDAIADKAIEMIEEGQDDERPFFLYLAHVAPHWPLHAREEDIARYEGAYLKGWDATRTARHEEMLSRGILQHPWEISPRDPEAPPWPSIELSDWEARRMAVYAAMVDRMDQSLGRVLDRLKRLGEYDNTLILFLSDNGGCAELMAEDGWAKFFPDVTHDGRKMTMGNRPDVEPGGPLTYMSYDLPWANVSNTPYRKFKHWVHEGGISTPLIAHWPKRLKTPNVRHAACHVVDLLPTILDAAGAGYPSELGGHAIQPTDGESLLLLLDGRRWEREQPIFFEHEGNSAIRLGNVKLVREFGRPWELYDMEQDRTELQNLIAKNAPLAKRLVREYESWAESAGVLDWNILLPRLQAAWQMDDIRG